MKTILITGATAGIGRHAALELLRQGHHVIATGRRETALATLKAEAWALASSSGGRLDGRARSFRRCVSGVTVAS